MKTPDKIKNGLSCCHGQYSASCGKCSYSNDGRDCGRNGVQIMKDAYVLIQQMEAKDVKQSQRIAELEQELAAVKRERDAAVADICKMAMSKFPCDVCSNDHRNDPVCKSHQGDCSECSLHCPCDGCFDDWEMKLTGNNFAWRGVCSETEVQE